MILMSDINKYIGSQGDLLDFFIQNDLNDAVGLLNPTLEKDSTYINGTKRIDYIFLSNNLAATAIKAEHHQFYQHFISDHKSVYI